MQPTVLIPQIPADLLIQVQQDISWLCSARQQKEIKQHINAAIKDYRQFAAARYWPRFVFQRSLQPKKQAYPILASDSPAAIVPPIATTREPVKRKRQRKAIYRAKYDRTSKTIEVMGKIIDLSSSPYQAAVLELTSSHPLLFRRRMTFGEIFSHGRLSEELRSQDIEDEGRLKTAVYNLNKRIQAVPPNEKYLLGRGGIMLNPHFYKSTS